MHFDLLSILIFFEVKGSLPIVFPKQPNIAIPISEGQSKQSPSVFRGFQAQEFKGRLIRELGFLKATRRQEHHSHPQHAQTLIPNHASNLGHKSNVLRTCGT